MTSSKGLVLDANILLRAVFRTRVRHLLETYEDVADFHSLDVCFREAEAYIPDLAKRRGLDLELARAMLGMSTSFVQAPRSLRILLRPNLTFGSPIGNEKCRACPETNVAPPHRCEATPLALNETSRSIRC